MSREDDDRLDLILQMIGHLRRRLDGTDEALLHTDADELDLTAFRLAVIGEAAHRLSAVAKARHPAIPWVDMYRMRNIIIHDYGSIDAGFVWRTVHHDLASLEAACRAELARPGG